MALAPLVTGPRELPGVQFPSPDFPRACVLGGEGFTVGPWQSMLHGMGGYEMSREVQFLWR